MMGDPHVGGPTGDSLKTAARLRQLQAGLPEADRLLEATTGACSLDHGSVSRGFPVQQAAYVDSAAAR
jgi:hypothetical protein